MGRACFATYKVTGEALFLTLATLACAPRLNDGCPYSTATRVSR